MQPEKPTVRQWSAWLLRVHANFLSQGLEDQLLGEVVRRERPDLEEARDRLVVSISNDKRQLVDLEDKVCVCVVVWALVIASWSF
jgi:hypothetical protein